ncbi:pentatricopeptide repeat-containing protein At5g04780, mitochondrial isoform X3 [Cucurbita pepo subsp. pepo]|uniref:pentatricopeptide repeat-containing protein At5g04780, mitochondrial isoform X3 n=1 Tax=Cucurbita pepo subsp. pepo TaxID=3664 RepID=UPI000C9D37F7|nr:pentatricopeptide repeat-containing protein At5g04780, mitochondrial isoform X3 [Cucurbita pepo subsp. pepo]
MGFLHVCHFATNSGKIFQFLSLRVCINRFFASSSCIIECEKGTTEDFCRTHVSYVLELLKLCAKRRLFLQGKACHARILLMGLQAETLTSNILINMYSKCGSVDVARQVFDEMPSRSLVSWSTMIGSLTQNAKCALSECQLLHAFAVKAAMNLNVFVATALLDVYAKCGLMNDAANVFESMSERSVVTWSSMAAGYVQNAMYEEALALFRKAWETGLKHDQFLMSSVICACAGLAAMIEGNQVNALLSKSGFCSNIFVASSLIDMYAKCGGIEEAYKVFRDVEDRNVVLWNAMISGLSRHARSLEVMILFEKMQQIGLNPNDVTFVSVLSACGHMGLVEKGQKYFDLMIKEYHLAPNVYHYSCMVDALSRAGRTSDAYDLICKMPFRASASMWGSLLASCRTHGNLELAEVAAKNLFDIEPHNAGNYLLLSNMYAANGKWDEVAKARKLLKESDVKKERGKSWIEIKNEVHSFMVGERNHPKIAEIYSKLNELIEELQKLGYQVETQHDLHQVEESRKQELLRHHSEKLAFTMGLLFLPPNAPLRIMKNLRICGDCHSFMKLVSKLVRRDVVVRDTNRFHHFTNGHCSCGDFW